MIPYPNNGRWSVELYKSWYELMEDRFTSQWMADIVNHGLSGRPVILKPRLGAPAIDPIKFFGHLPDFLK